MGKQKYTQVQKQKKCKNMNPKYNPQCKRNKQKYVEKKDTNKNAQTKSIQQLQTNNE